MFMIKLIARYFLIVFFICGYSYAEIIKDISVSGNKRISSETIKVLGDITIQKDFDKNELNNILKKLYETNFFKT